MITVKELLELCMTEISNGNGNKQIYISDDIEGNGFHPLVFKFTTDVNTYAEDGLLRHVSEEDLKKAIILG